MMELNFKQLISECEKTNPEIIIEGLKIILDNNIQMRKELIKDGHVIGIEFLNDIISRQKKTAVKLENYFKYVN